MSRIGLKPITVLGNVEFDIYPGLVYVAGSKGKLDVVISAAMQVKLEGCTPTVSRPDDSRDHRAQHGLGRTLINSAYIGVTDGYTKNLAIHGVGIRAAMKGKTLELQLGYSHPVTIEPP